MPKTPNRELKQTLSTMSVFTPSMEQLAETVRPLCDAMNAISRPGAVAVVYGFNVPPARMVEAVETFRMAAPLVRIDTAEICERIVNGGSR